MVRKTMTLNAALLENRAQLKRVIATLMMIALEAWFVAMIIVDMGFQTVLIAVNHT